MPSHPHRPHGRPHTCNTGFTLVELLVVIGIIALLISILLPTLGRARAAARSVQCMSNLRQMYIADVAYMNRYKNWHMPGWQGHGQIAGFLTNDGLDYWTALEEFRRTLQLPFLSNKATGNGFRGYIPKNRLCPDFTRGFQAGEYHPADAPSNWIDLYVNFSYGMNVDGVDYDGIAPTTSVVYNPTLAPQCEDSLGDKTLHGFKNTQVKHAADKIFICDAMYWWVNEFGSGVSPGWQGKVSDYSLLHERPHTGTLAGVGAYNTERSVAWRHQKDMANVLFFDGHVASMPKTFFANKNAAGVVTPNLAAWRVLE